MNIPIIYIRHKTGAFYPVINIPDNSNSVSHTDMNGSTILCTFRRMTCEQAITKDDLASYINDGKMPIFYVCHNGDGYLPFLSHTEGTTSASTRHGFLTAPTTQFNFVKE